MALVPTAELALAKREAERTQRRIAQERRRQRELKSDRVATPPPVEGRAHLEVQTEPFLHEIAAAPREEIAETQTDPLLDRPSTPLFVPPKAGRDAETQIAPGDLFDFDREVDPLLDVLVGKSVEQAVLEALQEEELEALRLRQAEHEQRRADEEVEAQRLAAAEARREAEKERRIAQGRARLAQEKEARAKLAARAFARAFLATLEPRVLARLEDDGVFHDPVAREVEASFMPWLYGAVDAACARHAATHSLLDSLIAEAAAAASAAAPPPALLAFEAPAAAAAAAASAAA